MWALIRGAPPAAVNKAYKALDDEEKLQYCQGVVEEARAMIETKVPRGVLVQQASLFPTQ